MKKYRILVISFLFFLSGCAIFSSNITFTPLDGLRDAKISSRTIPAKISKESDKALKAQGYAHIGFVRSEDVVKTCWGDDCRNFTCSDNLSHGDTTKEVLTKAAAQGGDLVILHTDSVRSENSTTKTGKCTGGYSTSYTEQECSGGYGKVARVCQNVTKKRYTCTSWQTDYGRKCTFVSAGTVWRHDPELIKHFANIEREKKRLTIEANAKKDKYVALRNAYKENSVSKGSGVDLVSFKVGGKYGFKDKNGKIVIEPQFTDTVFGFSEGLTAVAIGEKNDRKWGFIDKTGKWIIRPSYEYAGYFSEGLGNVRVNEKWGYINKAGQFIIRPQFKNAKPFVEGIAVVLMDKKWGFIDKTGNVVIKPRFDMAYPFSEGLAAIEMNKNKGYIDKKGNMIIEPQFDRAYPFSDGLAAVEVNKKNGYIDKKGNFIIKPQFDSAYKFIDGIAEIKIGNKEGYVNKTGEVFMEP